MLTIVAFVIVLGVLIFVHELGHFITAKLAGIAVPRFSIGLGPKIWGFRVGETEYVISALPLGGYVKMTGMGEDEAIEALEGGADGLDVPPERRFDAKSVPVRAAVISAGVVMNFLFAVVVFAGLIQQRGALQPVVDVVFEGSHAEQAGLRPGDQIVAVDSLEISQAGRFGRYIQDKGEGLITITVEREGQRLELATRVGSVIRVDNETGDTTIYEGIGIQWDTTRRLPVSLVESAVGGWSDAVGWSGLILRYIGELFVGKASFRDLGGPITIGQLSGQAARAGVGPLFYFMAVLSVNLAILNLLPVPILDGGHLVFLAIEAVRGRALSLETRARASQVGLIFILALMVWALTSDFLRISGN